VVAALRELDSGSRNEIPDGARDQHLSRPGDRRHARSDVDGDAGHSVSAHFALARVQAGADLDAEAAHRVANGASAADRPRWAVERGQKAVAGLSYLRLAPALELATDEDVVAVQQVTPLAIAEFDRSLRGPDDVRERTVARTRSVSAPRRTPVRNSSISSRIASWSPTNGR
jgi:hypothetical protein